MEWCALFFAMHLYVVADLPPEYGVFVWQAASQEQIDPYDLAAVLVSERSGKDRDFSVLVGAMRGYKFTWKEEAEGDGGERGLFQLMPRHAKKAGFKRDDLWRPWPNVRTAAAVVRHNKESHENCEGRRWNWHTWVAHYKCAPSARDDLDGGCYWSQRKWLYVRTSLVAFFSPDFRAIAKQERRELNRKLEDAAEDAVGM